MIEDTAVALDSGLAVAVEALSRRSSAAAADYRPVTSVFHRFFRREWREITLGEDAGVDDEDDDDEMPEEEAGEDLDGMEADERWALRDVSFTVPRGKAVALVGTPSGGRVLLMRVLAGHVLPTAGHALIRGRRGPTVEAAEKLMRPDMTPDKNLRLLAGLMGVPRAERERFVGELLDVAFGPREAPGGRNLKNAFAKIAAASVLDPTADVLLIDSFPTSDQQLRRRCLEQLSSALAGGATVLISSDDLELVRGAATEAIWLEHGSVVAQGPVEDVLAELERAAGAGRRRDRGVPRPFDARAAILELAVEAADGAVSAGGELAVAALLELVETEASAVFRLRVRDQEETLALAVSSPQSLGERGRYRVCAAIPTALPEGAYRVELEASVVAGGEPSTLRRSVPVRIGSDPGDVPEVTEETVGEAGGPVEGEPEPVGADWTVTLLEE